MMITMGELKEMTDQQDILHSANLALVNNPKTWTKKLKGMANDHLGNGLRRYTYRGYSLGLSKGAEELLNERGFDFSVPKAFSYFERIKDTNGKRLLTPEHVTPIAVIKEELKKIWDTNGCITSDELRYILDTLGKVYWVRKDTEDSLLNEAGYKSTVPSTCNPWKNPLERYHACGIGVSDEVVLISE